MSKLTRRLAQEIVRRTMNVIQYNVNVMDEHGVIIGSGDNRRIGQLHEGAVIAIERRGRFEVDADLQEKLSGVQHGTNLVIEFQNEVVGVIGITGNPIEVEKYGQLVKMTAEMYLEQLYLQEQAQWDKRLREDFLLSVIHASPADYPMMKDQAKRLGIDLSIPRIACILELQDDQTGDEVQALHMLQQVVSVLQQRESVDTITIRNSSQVVWLQRVLSGRDMQERIHKGINTLLVSARDKWNPSVKVAIGKAYSDLEGLIKCYTSARDALYAGRVISPEQTVYDANDFINETLFVNLKPTWNTDELVELAASFVKQDKLGELWQTLLTYIEENGDQQLIASKLSIHRNTLRYRLQRIYEITDKDPWNLRDLFTLQTAMWLYLYRKITPK
ncbi:helix-turn-helix domain-containing protein [Paenibacillus sp. N1-5-1-14]|uniref:sugar diacid recognition domain-containing protein n=1 Tax=Paenibacillus radicibacter TaxID=2972488 RepID=UPI002159B1C3|nr:sugar diacid recognition domain-containing protein [Paenibacillus radicibacter]MCR8643175.1 helix-turn-helix domain-containing protein [Paenibacillus radicibacter]